ncbi:MAG: chemotaxis protein CheA [Gammaproteobacteria bacterium]|nr:chemotaxis protein CheA [Gammaproteobacteria bacterium]
MSIDLSEFHDIFFEECNEGLSVMESGLLNLDNGTDVEEINAIFRAAHSIKGGSASFGFSNIAEFTHVMETLLDEMRDGRREVIREIVDLLLESVDVLRDMVAAAKDDQENDEARTADVLQKLQAVLDGEQPSAGETQPADVAASVQAEENTDASTASAGWKIVFKPYPEILKNGCNPTRIFHELDMLGDLTVVAGMTALPPPGEIDPESCYLDWTLELRSDCAEQEVRELFSWVEDECELSITSLADPAEQAPAKAPESSARQPDADSSENTAPETATVEPTEQQAVAGKPATAAKAKPTSASKDAGSIRVGIDKVDALINMVGELVITQSMLSQIGSDIESGSANIYEKLLDGISQLERNTRELQESVLQIRMLPISFSFSRFPRLVRDLSSSMGKNIELKMTGEHTEVDKNVLEKIADPLVHLVRNSLDHGIETPEVRKQKGKPEAGILELCAYHEGGDIIIKVIDDGAGLDKKRILQKAVDKGLVSENEELGDEKIFNLIFMPGFSTAEKISDVSGRGVGMDVVRRNVRDLGGNVTINNNQVAGSTVTIRLPLTLSILDGQLARIGDETYIISLVSIIESLQMQTDMISSISGQSELYRLRDEYIPIIRINRLFGSDSGAEDLLEGLLVVVEADGQRVGLFVDDLLGQQQVVIKSLESNFKQIQGISGATILGDGKVALIMDVPGLIQRHFDMCKSGRSIQMAA